jgi:hypothetical protein
MSGSKTGEDRSKGRTAFGGIFVRKECWALSLPAKISLIGIIFGCLWFGFRSAHNFLAVTSPEKSDVLVVEAWIPRYGLVEAIKIFKEGGYHRMIASGSVREDDLSAGITHMLANDVAVELERFGMPKGTVTPISSPEERKDRTYNMALSVKHYLATNGLNVKSIDVLTVGSHSRRSRLLFQKAFGDSAKVGIISVPDRGYDGDHWWRTSEGVRDVVGEAIAYVYARVLFRPPTADEH